MSGRPTVRPALLLGLALGGVLVGHTLTYRVLVPDAHARTAELAATGHGYLFGANALGLVAVIAALSVLFLGELVRAHAGVPRVLGRLIAFQLAAFAAMEVLERLGSGAGLRHLLPVLAVGLPVQILVAAAVALLVRLVTRAAATAADRVSRGTPARSFGSVALLAATVAAPALAAGVGPPPGRAPPISVVR